MAQASSKTGKSPTSECHGSKKVSPSQVPKYGIQKSTSTAATLSSSSPPRYEGIKQDKQTAVVGGYEIPKKEAIVGGYELPMKSSGCRQKTSADQLLAEPVETKPFKSDATFIVSVIVVVVVILGVIVGIIYAVYTAVAVPDEPLPDLTELCRKAQTEEKLSQFKQREYCFYHNFKYPHSNHPEQDPCSQNLKCHTTGMEIHFSDNYELHYHFGQVDQRNGSLPDQTPCARGKWCQNGKCVATNDKRIKEYDEIPAKNGGVRNTCNEMVCLSVDDGKEHHLMQYVGKCFPDLRYCAQDKEANIVSLGFLVCDNPMPSHQSDVSEFEAGHCFKEFQYPIHVTKRCESCALSDGGATSDKCFSLFDKLYYHKCILSGANFNATGVCRFGICIPDLGFRC